MGAVGEISKNFWKVTTMFVPGIIILDVIFGLGLFHDLPKDWISFTLLLMWAVIISIPYFNMSSTFWVSIILKDKKVDLGEDGVYALAASLSLIYVLIHTVIASLLFGGLQLFFNIHMTLLFKSMTFFIIFAVCYYPFIFLTQKIANKFYALAKEKKLL